MSTFRNLILSGIAISAIAGGIVGISQRVSPGTFIDRAIERTLIVFIFSCFGVEIFMTSPARIISAAHKLTYKKLGY